MTTVSKITARLALSILLLSLSFQQTTKAQNCQTGYEMRTLKCNGHFQERCMPVNYSCKDCWKLETAPCPGSGLSHGGLTDYNSYESAYTAAERNKNNALNKGSNYDCIINDPRTYRVYLDDKASCGDPAIVTNLRNKIAPFLKRFEAEIAAYKNFLAGKPYKPGGVIAEYRDAIRRAEDDYNRLSLRLNDMTDENLSEFETTFNDAQNIEIQLKQVDTNYRNEQQQEAEQQRQRELAQQQAQQQEAAKQRREQQEEQRRQEEQRQAVRNQIIQQQQQVQQQTNQTIQDDIQQMSNTLTQGIDNIMAEEQRKEQAREALREREEVWREERQKSEMEAERQRRDAEEQRRIAEEQEMNRQTNIDANVLGWYGTPRSSSAISDNVKQVYYITYERSYYGGNAKVHTYTLYKYSDDTWMPRSDLLSKVGFTVNTDKKSTSRLLGPFDNKQTAMDAVAGIRAGLPQAVIDDSFLSVNSSSVSQPAGSDKDFWGK